MGAQARFVVFGEALTDFIREDARHWRSAAGGSPWNVARVGARLGLPTGFAGAVSRDLFGEEILRLSREAGLAPSVPPRVGPRAVTEAAQRYGTFHDLPISLEVT